jgi:hypothetical protein
MTQNDLPGNTPESTDIPNGHSPIAYPAVDGAPEATPEPATAAKPSCARGCLNIFGWVYLPFFMLPWRWKQLSQNQRIVGVLWAAVMVFVWINANSEPRVTNTYDQQAPAAEVQQAPAEQPAEAPVDACTAAVREFASDVRSVKIRAEGMRDTMQKYIDNTYTARQLELPVMSAFRELQILETPTCRPEPAQIVSALYRVQDAELLAFIEMTTAEAGGSSRETALRELEIQMPIVERELAQVDAWLDAIE